jgi:hypothetical protein
MAHIMIDGLDAYQGLAASETAVYGFNFNLKGVVKLL